jgi:hypothetical protein
MTSRSAINLRTVLQALVVSGIALTIGVLVPITDSAGHLSLLVGCCLAITIVGLLFAVPLHYLPAITLLATLLIPAEYSSLPRELQGASFGVVPLAVWMIRAPRSTRIPLGPQLLASLLGVWLILSAVFAPLHTHRGWEWLATVGMALVFSIVSAPTGLKVRDFRAFFLNVATLLGIYALLEGFILHRNVLFATFFDHTTWWASQHYNVSYRVTTLLGHPLVNGLVFSAAAVLAASDLAQKSGKTPMSLVRFIILVGATDATHSRGAAAALAAGVIVVILFSRRGRQALGTRRLALAISLLLGATFLVYGLKARDESRQGKESAQVRVTVINHALEAVNDLGLLGAGPGESEAYRKARHLPDSSVDLENSYAQLAVSLGPIGALLLLILLIAVVAVGVKNELVTGEAAALLTMIIDMGTFNTIEGHPNIGVLIALFVIAIVTAPQPPVPLSANSDPRGRGYSVSRERGAIAI